MLRTLASVAALCVLLISAGTAGEEARPPQVTPIDVHSFRVLESYSGPVSYYKIVEDPEQPPELETLVDGSAAADDLEAARACGWLDAEGPTEMLEKLIQVRPIEREAALRRFLRAGPPRPREPDRLRAWRSWALSGRRRP